VNFFEGSAERLSNRLIAQTLKPLHSLSAKTAHYSFQ
jgi:hypothetical protein